MAYGEPDLKIRQQVSEYDRQRADRDPLHGLNFPADGIIDDLANLDGPPPAIAINKDTRNVERLADWPPIKTAWVNDMAHAQFAKTCRFLNPINLGLCGLRTGDFEPLSHMNRLEGFALSINTKVDDISFISAMTSLKSLSLNDIKKPIVLTPLSDLTALEQLTLGGGIWNVIRMPSLAPLAGLNQVTHIDLTNIRVDDQSLAPLASITSLKNLHVSNQFPIETYAWLAAARPDIECNKFVAYELLKFEGQDHFMVTGKGKPTLDPDKADRLDGYIDRWNKLVAKYKSELAATD